jgi:AraC-like DNA-binding protein
VSTIDLYGVEAFARACQVAAELFAADPTPSAVLESVHGILSTVPPCDAALPAIIVARGLSALVEHVRIYAGRTSSSSCTLDRALAALLMLYNVNGVTLHRVASALALTDSYLSAMIVSRTQRGFLEHLHALRIIHAVGLLATTDEPVARIANHSGYRQLSHFDRHFHARLHATPVRFRSFLTVVPRHGRRPTTTPRGQDS